MNSRMFHVGLVPFIVSILVSSVFKRFGDAGLTDIITESGVIACGSLSGVITGHHYNRSVRILKLPYKELSLTEPLGSPLKPLKGSVRTQ